MFTQIFNDTTVTANMARETLTKAQYAIYNYLSNNQKGRAQTDQLGQELIGAAVGCCREHVCRSIGVMVDKGLVLIRRQYQVVDGKVVIAENIYVVVRKIYHYLAEWRQLQKLRAGWLANRRKKAARKAKSPSDKKITAFHDPIYKRGDEQAVLELTTEERAELEAKYRQRW